MTFGQIIKKLRRDSDMTQEHLAELLSISPQAVSRWETDAAMPDVSLLPPIANLFNITTDYLLGVDIAKKDTRIAKIWSDANEESYYGQYYRQPERCKKAFEIIRDGLKLYPDSWKLKNSLAEYLSYSYMADNSETYSANLREANGICEDIIERCPDNEYRFEAISRICLTANKSDNIKRALQLVKTMPRMTCCREELTIPLLEGELLETECRDHINVLELCLFETLLKLSKDKSPDIVSSYYNKSEVIARTLYEDDDFIKSEYFWYGQSAWAKAFAETGDNNSAFECLEKELRQYYHTTEHCFKFMSDLVPKYIKNECGNVTFVDICEKFCNKAKDTLKFINDDFPESIKSDSRYLALIASYNEFIDKYNK